MPRACSTTILLVSPYQVDSQHRLVDNFERKLHFLVALLLVVLVEIELLVVTILQGSDSFLLKLDYLILLCNSD